VLAICGLVMAALIVRRGELLMLAMPFMIYLLVGILQAPEEITLLASRTIDRFSVFAGEPAEVQINIKNQGSGLANLYLEDPLFPSMTVHSGQAGQRISLPAGEMTGLNYTFKAARGVYEWSTVHANASDPFGLFELQCDIPAPARLLVRPMPMKLRHIRLRPRFTLHTPGPIPAHLAGSGTDFLGVREYRPGDPLHRLNWRLAARHPRKLFTREYEQEEIADVGLILDTRRLINYERVDDELLEYSVSAAASLSEIVLKEGNRVGLLVFGQSMAPIFPGYGKKQYNRILYNLAQAALSPNLPLVYLEYFPARLFPSRSIIVMLSTLGPRDLGTYARLRSFGYDVLLINPDPVEYAARKLPPTELNSLAVRAARVERIIQLKQLMKLGVRVVDWQVDQPFGKVVREISGYLKLRGNSPG